MKKMLIRGQHGFSRIFKEKKRQREEPAMLMIYADVFRIATGTAVRGMQDPHPADTLAVTHSARRRGFWARLRRSGSRSVMERETG